MKKQHNEFTLKDLLGIFIPKLWIIVIIAILCGAAMGLYSTFFKQDTYTSASTWYIYRENSSSTTTSDLNVAQDMGETYKYIIKSKVFLTSVIDELKKDEKYKDINLTTSALNGMINFTQEGTAPIFKISVTATDPELAYRLSECANDLAYGAINERIPNSLEMSPIDSPELPRSANSKNTARNAVIIALVGAVVSAFVIWFVSLFDVIIRDKKRIEDTFDYRVIGVIPRQDVNDEEKNGGAENETH